MNLELQQLLLFLTVFLFRAYTEAYFCKFYVRFQSVTLASMKMKVDYKLKIFRFYLMRIFMRLFHGRTAATKLISYLILVR